MGRICIAIALGGKTRGGSGDRHRTGLRVAEILQPLRAQPAADGVARRSSSYRPPAVKTPMIAGLTYRLPSPASGSPFLRLEGRASNDWAKPNDMSKSSGRGQAATRVFTHFLADRPHLTQTAIVPRAAQAVRPGPKDSRTLPRGMTAVDLEAGTIGEEAQAVKIAALRQP
jgi:hypothetical protein